jgi:hypothetical protein
MTRFPFLGFVPIKNQRFGYLDEKQDGEPHGRHNEMHAWSR